MEMEIYYNKIIIKNRNINLDSMIISKKIIKLIIFKKLKNNSNALCFLWFIYKICFLESNKNMILYLFLKSDYLIIMKK